VAASIAALDGGITKAIRRFRREELVDDARRAFEKAGTFLGTARSLYAESPPKSWVEIENAIRLGNEEVKSASYAQVTQADETPSAITGTSDSDIPEAPTSEDQLREGEGSDPEAPEAIPLPESKRTSVPPAPA
jgi:hypothetical protein